MNTKICISRTLLPKEVWTKITEACFSGDWEAYKASKLKEELPANYKAAIGFARENGIDTVEKAELLCQLIRPYKVEKVEKATDDEVYSEVVVEGFIVPTTASKTSTVPVIPAKTSTKKPGEKTSSPQRVLSVEEKIQNILAQAVWKARNKNFKLAVENPAGFEAVAKKAEELWREKFLELNSHSNAAKAMLELLHYPKAIMSIWVRKNELNK